MQIVLDQDEAWSLMMLISSYVIDHSGVSQEGKQAIRTWRKDRAEGTPLMEDLAESVNEVLGTYVEEMLTRRVRRKGRFVTSKELGR